MENNSHQNDIPIWFSGTQRWMTGLTKRTTCADVIYALLYSCGLHETDSTDNYAIFEKWREVERPLSSRTKILKIWYSWGEEQPNVQLNLRSLDDYFLPGESSLYLRSRRRHKKSGRHRSRHTTSCRCHNRRGCVECSRLRSLEQLVKLVVSQERKIQDLGDRIYDTDRLIDRHESRIHHHRVQQNGQDYVQNSYLNSHSSESSSSLDCSSFSSLDLKDLSAAFRDSTLQELEEISRLCDDLAHMERRLGEEQTKIKEMAPEIERLAEKMGVVAEMEGEANAELESTRTEMIRAVTLHVTNEYNERELDRKIDLCLSHLDKKSQAVKELQDELSRCQERLGAGDVSEMSDSDHSIRHALESRDTPPSSDKITSSPLDNDTYWPFERGWTGQPSKHLVNSQQISYSVNSQQSNSYSPNPQQSNSYSPNQTPSNSYPPSPQQSIFYSSSPQPSNSNSPPSASRQLSNSYFRQSSSYSTSHQETSHYSMIHQQTDTYSPNFQQTNSSNLFTKVHSKNSAGDTRGYGQKKSVTFSQDLEDSVFLDDPGTLSGNDDSRKENAVDSSNVIQTILNGSVSFKDDSSTHHDANLGQIVSDPSTLTQVTVSRDSRSERRNGEGKVSGFFKNRSRSAERSSGYSLDRTRAQINHSEHDGSNLTNHRDCNSHVVNQYGLELFDWRDFRRNNSQGHVTVPNGYHPPQDGYENNRHLKRPDQGQAYSGDRLQTLPLHFNQNSEGGQNALKLFHAQTDESQIPNMNRDRQFVKFDKPDIRGNTNTRTQPDNGHIRGAAPGMQRSSWKDIRDTSAPAHNSGHLFDQGISDPRFNNDSSFPRFGINGVVGKGPGKGGRTENSGENLLNSVLGYKQQTDMSNGVDVAGSPRATGAHVRHRPTLTERGRLDVPGGPAYSSTQEVISTKQQTDIHGGQQTSDALAGRQKNEQTRAPNAVTDNRNPHGFHWTNTHNRLGRNLNHGDHVSRQQDSNHVQSIYNLPPSNSTHHSSHLLYGGDEPRVKTESKSYRNHDTAHRSTPRDEPPSDDGKNLFLSGAGQHPPSNSYPNKDISNGGRGALYHIVSNKMNRTSNDSNSVRQSKDRREGHSSISESSPLVLNTGSVSINKATKPAPGAAKLSNGISAVSGARQNVSVPIKNKYSENITHQTESNAANGSPSFTYPNQATKNYGQHNEVGIVSKDWESGPLIGSYPYFSTKTGKDDTHVNIASDNANKTPMMIFEDNYQAKSDVNPENPIHDHLTSAKHSTISDAKHSTISDAKHGTISDSKCALTVNLNDIPILNNKQSGKGSRDFNFTTGMTHRPLMTNGHGVVRTKLEDANDSNSDTGLSSMHSDETANMETLV